MATALAGRFDAKLQRDIGKLGARMSTGESVSLDHGTYKCVRLHHHGLIFVSLLFGTTQWQRLVPTSGTVFVQVWSTFVHYATFHFPPEPNGYYGYNALQQLTSL